MKLPDTKITLFVNVVPDYDVDISYLDQEEFEDRKFEYANGMFTHCGIFVELELWHQKTGIRKTYKSPGLWNIESDCGNEYAYETAGAQLRELADNCPEICGLDIDEKKLVWKI